LLTSVACANASAARAASQRCRRAAGADRLGEVDLPLLAGRAAPGGDCGERLVAVARQAEQRVSPVVEQLLGERRAQTARRSGDDEQLQAAWAIAGFDCWMPAIAHSRLPSAGLTRCQTSSKGSATPSICSRIRPWKRTLTTCRSGLAGDVEHLGVDADDIGALRRRAALLQLELDRSEHLRRGEGAQVVEVAGVVGRLQADEDHLGDALEALGVEACGQGGGERRCGERGIATGEGLRLEPGRRHWRAGAGELKVAGTGRRFRAEAAQQEADREEGDAGEQEHRQDVAEGFAEAEMAHQRGDAEASGEAGDRPEPRALRRCGGRSGRGCGRARGLGRGRGRLGRIRRGARRHAALHAGGAAAADPAGVGVAGHGGGRDQGDCESDDERLHSFSRVKRGMTARGDHTRAE
jgi:hypothetical protein